jgi:hypothetical protein
MTPAAGEGTSIVALSVSSSRSGWSVLTASPSFTIQRAMRPSVTVSAPFGTSTATPIAAPELWGVLVPVL